MADDIIKTTNDFTVKFTEKSILDVDFTEKEVLEVKVNKIDIVEYVQKEVISNLKYEVPTKLSATQFQTSVDYTQATLQVTLNGLKVPKQYITYDTATKFTIADTTKDGDIVEVMYIEKTT